MLQGLRCQSVAAQALLRQTAVGVAADDTYGWAQVTGHETSSGDRTGRAAAPQEPDAVSFGPFSLHDKTRLLEKDGVPVKLGSRALDILRLLVSRAGEVVPKNDLLAHAWPGLVVEEINLRVHIAELRKALGDGKAGARYVTNIPSRGYCFVAPVQRSAPAPAAAPAPTSAGRARDTGAHLTASSSGADGRTRGCSARNCRIGC